jgi:hypothetical protein
MTATPSSKRTVNLAVSQPKLSIQSDTERQIVSYFISCRPEYSNDTVTLQRQHLTVTRTISSSLCTLNSA